jgi:hypothetical protein
MKWRRSEGAVVLDCGALRGEVEKIDSGSKNQKAWRWSVSQDGREIAKGWSWKQGHAKASAEARMK